jgi:hypothetical protein
LALAQYQVGEEVKVAVERVGEMKLREYAVMLQ